MSPDTIACADDDPADLDPADHDPLAADGRPACRISEALEQSILLGEFADGERLDETRLAVRFAVSRTPVREALSLLVATRLVEHRPNRGTFVRVPRETEVLEMFEVMAELEAYCGKLCTLRATDADLERLDAVAGDCERAAIAGDSDHYYRENGRLHATLYELSGNTYLETVAKSLHRRLQAYRRLQLRVPRRVVESVAVHRAIVDSIRSRDAERVAELLRAHLGGQGVRFSRLHNAAS